MQNKCVVHPILEYVSGWQTLKCKILQLSVCVHLQMDTQTDKSSDKRSHGDLYFILGLN